MKILRNVEPRYFNCSVHNDKKKVIKIAQVECLCSCGETFITDFKLLESGQIKNCGCSPHAKNPPSRRAEHVIWINMINKCTNPNSKGYKNYGGKGISVCKDWENSFPSFLQDVGKIPSKHHRIVRIDDAGNFDSNNCRWAIGKEKYQNKRNNRLVKFYGKKIPIKKMNNPVGRSYSRLYAKIKKVGDELGNDFEILVRRKIPSIR
jgi:hypothetical protein